MSRNSTVADLMTVEVITLTEDDSIERADLEMRYARIRHVPVIDEQRRVVGILSDRDILAWLARCHDTHLSVAHAMTREVEMIEPTASAQVALSTLLRQRIGCLPVVDASERLLGIVTETDFLRFTEEVLGQKTATDRAHRADPGR